MPNQTVQWRVPDGFSHGLLTPMTASGEIDYATLERLTDFHVSAGATSLCPLLHLGESPSLSIVERCAVLDIVASTAGPTIPIIVHVSAPDTTRQIALAQHARVAGAAAVTAMSPYCRDLPVTGVTAHFRALATTVDIPLIPYHSPATGHSLPVETILDLRTDGLAIVGVKDASFDTVYANEVCNALLAMDGDFAFMPGIEYLLPLAPIGARAGFSICGSIAPRLVAALGAAIADHRWDDAAPLQLRMSGLLQLLLHDYPASAKAATAIMGRPVGPTRAPLAPLLPSQIAALKQSLAVLGVLDDEPVGW